MKKTLTSEPTIFQLCWFAALSAYYGVAQLILALEVVKYLMG